LVPRLLNQLPERLMAFGGPFSIADPGDTTQGSPRTGTSDPQQPKAAAP
jgi:hypothetical protein